MFGFLRFIAVLWILGFIVLALAAFSGYLFSSPDTTDRSQRLTGRLSMALVWPIALMSSAGRTRLRRGFQREN
jgi:hypothetical protein